MAREFETGLEQIRKLIELGAMRLDYEALIERHYRRLIRTGDIVFDVGAHTGRHLQHFVQLVGRNGEVLAFEPLPTAYGVL